MNEWRAKYGRRNISDLKLSIRIQSQRRRRRKRRGKNRKEKSVGQKCHMRLTIGKNERRHVT
jgi:hypothetical protein